MPRRQKEKNPFRPNKDINRLIKMMRARKRHRAEIELPGFTPDPGAPAGEEIWNAPGFGPPPKTGAQANLRELSRRAKIT